MNKKVFLALFLWLAGLIGWQVSAQQLEQLEIKEGWQFKQERSENWYSATVPGVVHTDLINNEIIEDPFFRLNERGVQWVDKENWIYKTTLNVPESIWKKEHIELFFEGLDTYAEVYLNDSLILNANNMFREWRVDVKSLLKKENNELLIRFLSPYPIDVPKFDALPFVYDAGNDQSANGGMFDKKISVFIRKAGYHFGWDWGPRLVTCGIWRPIHLQGWNEARLANIQYIQSDVSEKKATIRAIAEVIADKAGEAVLNIEVEGLPHTWTKRSQVEEGLNRIETTFTIRSPRLWWCNGLGDPHLYRFTATLAMNGETDLKTERIGIRDVQVIREKDKDGTSFYFRLNGVNVFAKGANYIPQDNFIPRVTPEQYERTILDAVNANMNMLRIWGGGFYENKIFYDLCDEHGIMVWQDFMFACSLYPAEGELMENIRQEAIDNVKRLRNHPSIVIWCGNNEISTAWYNWGWKRRYEKMGKEIGEKVWKQLYDLFFVVLDDVVKEYDETRFYWPSSPYNGYPYEKIENFPPIVNPHGDAHYWGVWHGKDSISNYNVAKSRFFSEYGFQSFPEYQSVLKYASEERDHDIYSEVMMAHQRGGKHANGLIEWYLLNEYRQPKDFQNFLYMGQLLQGDAIKTAIEAHRRDMPYCMGTLYWQHNDCWPVASWSSRDYYGRWKAQHYFARKAFMDILVSPIREGDDLNVYIVSDRIKAAKGKLKVQVMDLFGNTVYTTTRSIVVPANASKCPYSIPVEKLLNGKSVNEVFVHVEFAENKKDSYAYTNNYFLTRYKNISFPEATIKASSVKVDGGFDVTLTSDVFARGVFLSIEGLDNFFSDNYFDLLPGETRVIHVTTDVEQELFDRQLKIETISDAY